MKLFHRWLIIMLLIFFQSCSEKKPMTTENVNAHTTAHSIGRNIIDLPADFKLADGTTATFAPVLSTEASTEFELSILGSGMSLSQFSTRVSDRQKKLAAAGGSGEDELKAVIKQSETAVLFRVMEVGESYLSEMDLYLGGTYLRVVGHSYHGKFEAVESSMRKFIERISLTSQKNDVDAFHLGPLSISGKNVQENADFAFRSTKRPDILINATIDTYGRDDRKTLLSRLQGDDSLLATFNVGHRVLRKRELTIAGMRAQEWLGVARLDGEDNYGFALETMRPNPAPARPMLHIELDSGQYDGNQKKQPNSLTDESAVNLWDTIIKSIRSNVHSAG